MDVDEARSRLSLGLDLVASAVAGLDDDEAWFAPRPGAWSVRDVLAHLAHGEANDFRGRLRATLQDPDRAWAGVDAEAVVLAARRERASVHDALERFRAERAVSLAWLASLDAPDLDRAPAHGPADRRAGDLLAAWVAHDLHRVDQIVRLRLGWWCLHAAPYSVADASPVAAVA